MDGCKQGDGLRAEALGQDNRGPRTGQEGPARAGGPHRIPCAEARRIRFESRERDYDTPGGRQDGGRCVQAAQGADGALNPLDRGVH